LQKRKILPESVLNDQPFGRLLTMLGKGYLELLRNRLQHLDIDRYYYALVLIGTHNGSITQQELSVLLDSNKVSIVRIVDYLSEKGYVHRVRKTDDRRKHDLIVTEKGKQAIPEIRKSFTEINEIVLRGLEQTQISDLTRCITSIKRNITQK
jgi:MarR family transcriptional regulator, transcriptional regulator for hemolysin